MAEHLLSDDDEGVVTPTLSELNMMFPAEAPFAPPSCPTTPLAPSSCLPPFLPPPCPPTPLAAHSCPPMPLGADLPRLDELRFSPTSPASDVHPDMCDGLPSPSEVLPACEPDVPPPLEPPPPPQPRFMPRALEVPGLMHIVDNLLADAHRVMEHWPIFFEQLKTFESFLVVPDRRRRFIWTCLKDQPLEFATRYVERWSSTLYEKRWKEVVRFSKALIKILGYLVRGFKAEKFIKGVDLLNTLWGALEGAASPPTLWQ